MTGNINFIFQSIKSYLTALIFRLWLAAITNLISHGLAPDTNCTGSLFGIAHINSKLCAINSYIRST